MNRQRNLKNDRDNIKPHSLIDNASILIFSLSCYKIIFRKPTFCHIYRPSRYLPDHSETIYILRQTFWTFLTQIFSSSQCFFDSSQFLHVFLTYCNHLPMERIWNHYIFFNHFLTKFAKLNAEISLSPRTPPPHQKSY